MSKKYLFVCGAPRSGTTLLSRLLGANDSVVLGIERFKGVSAKGALEPSLFEEERFFRFEEGDTNIKGPAFDRHYEKSRAKYSTASHIGDKIPNLYKRIGLVRERFGAETQFVFCFRNVVDVAASWNQRAKKSSDNWPAKNDFRQGTLAWNESLNAAVQAKKHGAFIVPFQYEAFVRPSLASSRECYAGLLHKLGLKLSQGDEEVLTEEAAKFNGIAEKRAGLTAEEVLEVLSLVDLAGLDRFLKEFHVLRTHLPLALRLKLKEFRGAV